MELLDHLVVQTCSPAPQIKELEMETKFSSCDTYRLSDCGQG